MGLERVNSSLGKWSIPSNLFSSAICLEWEEEISSSGQ